MFNSLLARFRRGGCAPCRLVGLPAEWRWGSRRGALFLLALGAGATGGCSPDFYKGQADAQVYQILRDRKYDTVGYNPEARVGESAVRNDAPGAASAAEARENANSVNGPGVVPAPGASAVPARAYEVIPQTVLPGI